MNQNQINFYKDELIVDEIITTLKNVVLNIFIFILCVFLFMNPYLLSNVVLFISVFAFIKVSMSFFSSPFQPREQIETQTFHIIDEDENIEILRNKIRKLKKDNALLKDKLENRELKRKMKTFTPKTISNPIEINVQFEEDENIEIDVSIEKEDNIENKENKEDIIILKEEQEQEQDQDQDIKDDKESLSEETLNSDENFSILEKDDEWSS
jgi:hypothetical protein